MFQFILGKRRVNFVKNLSFPTYPHTAFITFLDLLPYWVTNMSLNLYQSQTLVQCLLNYENGSKVPQPITDSLSQKSLQKFAEKLF